MERAIFPHFLMVRGKVNRLHGKTFAVCRRTPCMLKLYIIYQYMYTPKQFCNNLGIDRISTYHPFYPFNFKKRCEIFGRVIIDLSLERLVRNQERVTDRQTDRKNQSNSQHVWKDCFPANGRRFRGSMRLK